MKNNILLVFYWIAYYLGINRLFYFLNRFNQRVVTYHNIIPDELHDSALPHFGVSHSKSIFTFHIRFLKSRFKVTTNFGEIKSCIITFDDGFENNYSQAHKLMEAENIRGYFFVPIDMIVNNNLLWIDKILMWLSYVPAGTYTLTDSLKISINDNSSRQKSFITIWKALLKDYSLKERIIDEMEVQIPFEKLQIDLSLYKMRFSGMTSEQLDEMKRFGHKIGCHSVYHDILACLDPEALMKEIETSEKYLGTLFNTKVYSYPFGGEEEVAMETIKAISHSNFSCAVVNISHPDFEYDIYSIPRFSLPNTDNIYLLDAKLSGLEYFLKYKRLLPYIKGLK